MNANAHSSIDSRDELASAIIHGLGALATLLLDRYSLPSFLSTVIGGCLPHSIVFQYHFILVVCGIYPVSRNSTSWR